MNQQIVNTGSSVNRIYEFDGYGNVVERYNSETLIEYLRRLNVIFVDRDGAEHILPTKAHENARVLPVIPWEKLSEEQRQSERQRLHVPGEPRQPQEGAK